MDRVKLIALERAELEDTLALSDLVYEHLRRHTGQLLGAGDMSQSGAGGLLSHPVLTVNASTELCNFNSFAFASLSAGGDAQINGASGTPECHVIRFDSAATGHLNHPLDLSFSSAGSLYSIFCRAILIDTDSEPRRQFSVVTGLEEAVTLTTRRRERVQFSAAKSPTLPSGLGWVKIADYTVDVSRNFSFDFVSLWDALNAKCLNRLSNPSITESMISTSALLDETARDNSHTLGASEILALIRGQLARIIHQGSSDDVDVTGEAGRTWISSPVASLRQLSFDNDRQDVLISALSTLTTSLSAQIEANRVYYVGYRVHCTHEDGVTNALIGHGRSDINGVSLYWDASQVSVAVGIGDANLTRLNFEKISERPVIVLPVPDTGYRWAVVAHNCTPNLNAPSVPDSLTDTSSPHVNSPQEFGYAIGYREASPDIPLSSYADFDTDTARTYTITSHTDGSTQTTYNYAIPFILRMDPRLLSSTPELSYIYDIQLQIKRVAI